MTEVGWEGDPVGAITVADDTDSDDPAIRKLTAPAQDDVDMGPSWSPNGKQLAFLRFSYEGSAIYRVNVDGSGLRRLVGGSDIGSFGAPVWGPRSTNLITFVDHNDNCIHVVSPDGSNRRQVLCPKGRDGTPRAIQGLQWFPDGKHLLVCTYWDASVPANVRKVDVATGNPVAGFVRAMPGADQRFARRPATRAEERQEGRPCPGRRHWNKPVPDRRHQPGVLGRWQAGGVPEGGEQPAPSAVRHRYRRQRCTADHATPSNGESIDIGPVPAGTYYIKVVGELAYSGVNLRACYGT